MDRTTLQAMNVIQNMATQIEMGHGKVDVSRIEHEGRSGILFRPRASVIPVGQEGDLPAGEYWPVSGDVVIWIANEGGAKVIEKYLNDFLPALSAQVQDVAGWQPIETAQKNGWSAPILTCRMGEFTDWFGKAPVGGYAEPPETAYWNDAGDCWTRCQAPHDVWEPTHWMPLHAAPAKQEGGE
ncbi:DUF551 domain-containing protein [Agrobacterium leguminum]|uniref:DUF551 domain-containing protein n=1 Tax=Agrobacterium leguminum TaxID=2792015 RepID=A0A9X3HQ18_9HYPH|nr:MULTISPECIES: DUF551 domain-containing protein [Agrobacterium]MCZ7909350.1 DUF551 domain-containing protein [Agrobacterium leguminum]WFS67977.1 DUF551 domain-containing protein [Agrobacterium leguminum]